MTWNSNLFSRASINQAEGEKNTGLYSSHCAKPVWQDHSSQTLHNVLVSVADFLSWLFVLCIRIMMSFCLQIDATKHEVRVQETEHLNMCWVTDFGWCSVCEATYCRSYLSTFIAHHLLSKWRVDSCLCHGYCNQNKIYYFLIEG